MVGGGRAHLPGGGSATLTNALKHNPEALEEVDTVVPGQENKDKRRNLSKTALVSARVMGTHGQGSYFKSKTQ